jgi:peptide/nickel transport system permease protein
VVFGTRISLTVGVVSVFLGFLFGVAVGTFAAFKGGRIDAVVTEIANMLVAFPTILLGIMILSIWGSGFSKLVITLAVGYFPRFIRLSRGLTLSIKEKEFIEASKATGRGDLAIIFRHIIPNSISANIVAGTLWISAAILAQAGLSFLGLGIGPPTPTWGGMIRDGVGLLMIAPWISVFPGIAIMITVIGFNMLGDGIRDLLDPKLRGTI